jgi:hypothetical protein
MKKITLLFILLLAFATNAQTSIYSEDFSAGDISSWIFYDVNAVAEDDWFLTDESNWTEPFGYYTDNFLASFSWNGNDFTPDNIAVSPLISIPTAATDAILEFISGSGNDGDFFSEHYAVYVTTTSDQASILASTPVFEETLGMVGASVKTVDLSSFAGMDVYISFRHFNTTGEWVLVIDEIDVSSVSLSIEEFTEPHVYKIGCVNHYISIYNINSVVNYKVISLTGQTILEGKTALDTHTIDATSLASGVYIIEITNPLTNAVFRKKVAF